MEFTTLLGYLAGALTTIAFIPQVVQTVKTKSTKDISLIMFLVLFIGVCMWLAYGIILKLLPIIIPNTIVLVLAFIILFLKFKYK